jgi:hypothetical protein
VCVGGVSVWCVSVCGVGVSVYECGTWVCLCVCVCAACVGVCEYVCVVCVSVCVWWGEGVNYRWLQGSR